LGAEVNARDIWETTPLMHSHPEVISFMLEAGADRDAKDHLGRNALMHASRKGLADSVRILLEVGADFTAQDSTGLTALMLAAGPGSGETKFGMKSVQVEADPVQTAELLLRAGVDHRAESNEGKIALMYAKENGRENLMALLEVAEQ
jgi:ankyrin repeat protein